MLNFQFFQPSINMNLPRSTHLHLLDTGADRGVGAGEFDCRKFFELFDEIGEIGDALVGCGCLKGGWFVRSCQYLYILL